MKRSTKRKVERQGSTDRGRTKLDNKISYRARRLLESIQSLLPLLEGSVLYKDKPLTEALAIAEAELSRFGGLGEFDLDLRYWKRVDHPHEDKSVDPRHNFAAEEARRSDGKRRWTLQNGKGEAVGVVNRDQMKRVRDCGRAIVVDFSQADRGDRTYGDWHEMDDLPGDWG